MNDDHTPDSHSSKPDPSPPLPRTMAAHLARVFAEVRTGRLVLRRPDAGDTRAMFRVHSDPETNRYNPFGADPDLAASEATLCEWLAQWQADGCGYWAVTLPPATDVVGFGGVRRIAWRDRDVLNLYYKLVPTIWRRGYATELARAAVDVAQFHLPHVPVIARTRPDNVASARTAERAGLLRWPDLDTAEHLVFALGW
ncbi:MAG: GNAT family N-acetyltransferase [Ktedonobacterales bacterium]